MRNILYKEYIYKSVCVPLLYTCSWCVLHSKICITRPKRYVPPQLAIAFSTPRQSYVCFTRGLRHIQDRTISTYTSIRVYMYVYIGPLYCTLIFIIITTNATNASVRGRGRNNNNNKST